MTLLKQLSKAYDKVNSAQQNASYRSINKSLSKVQTQYKRLIAQDSGLKAKQITPRFALRKASKKSLRGYVSFGVKFGVALSEFKTKSQTVKIGKRKYRGVSVKLPEGRVIVKGGWLWNAKSGKSLVLMRKGLAKYPTAQPTYNLNTIANSHRQAMQKLFKSEFDATFSDQLKYEAKKL